MSAYRIEHYVTAGPPRDPFSDWLDGLRDLAAKVAIIRRIARIEEGNFGDHKFCSNGVRELRVDVGPGYRVYFAQPERGLVLLLCSGTKRTQRADIERAGEYWQDWQRRNDG